MSAGNTAFMPIMIYDIIFTGMMTDTRPCLPGTDVSSLPSPSFTPPPPPPPIPLNPLPDNKILDWFNLKQIADDIFKCI